MYQESLLTARARVCMYWWSVCTCRCAHVTSPRRCPCLWCHRPPGPFLEERARVHPASNPASVTVTLIPTHRGREPVLETCTAWPGPGVGAAPRPGRSPRPAGGPPSPEGHTEPSAAGTGLREWMLHLPTARPGAHTWPRTELSLWHQTCLASVLLRVPGTSPSLTRRSPGCHDHHGPHPLSCHGGHRALRPPVSLTVHVWKQPTLTPVGGDACPGPRSLPCSLAGRFPGPGPH